LTETEKTLIAALKRMHALQNLMMKKVNHGTSFYDAETIREMNEAPVQAARAITDAETLLGDES